MPVGHDGVARAGRQPAECPRKGRAMKSKRIATVVAAVGLLAVCATAAAPSAQSTKTVTISVASLIPGSTQAAIEQFNAQVAEFERANPSIKIKPVEYQWTGADVRGEARRRNAADRVRGAVHRRPHARRQRAARRPDVACEGAALLREVQQGSPRRRHRREGPDHRPAEGCVRAGTALQPASSSQQAGLDPNKPPTTWAQIRARRAPDHPEDRQARLRRDGQGRQHRRLDPDDRRLHARRPDGEGHRHEGGRDAEQPADGDGAEPAQADALDGQLDGRELRLRLERHQPGVRRRQRRHVHQRLGRLHEPRAGIEHRSVDLRSRRPAAREEQERRRARRRHRGRGEAERSTPRRRRPR